MCEQSSFFRMKSNSLSIRARYQPTKDIGSRNALNEHLFVAGGRATHDLHGVPGATEAFAQVTHQRLVGR